MPTPQQPYDVFQQVEASELPQITEQTPSDPEAVYTRELFPLYRSHTTDWREQLISDWDFYLGAQDSSDKTESARKKKQKIFNVDIIYQAVEQAIAMLTSNHPKFSATGVEDSDSKIASIFAALMQNIWLFNSGNQKLKHTIRDYYVGSMGWFYFYWDSLKNNGKGEICFNSVDPRKVYVDPAAKDFFFQDASHIIVEDSYSSERLQKAHNLPLELLQQFETEGETIDVSGFTGDMMSGSSSKKTSTTSKFYRVLHRFTKVKHMMYVLEKEDERFEHLMEIPGFSQQSKNYQCLVAATQKSTVYFVHPRNVSNVMKLYQQYGEVFHEVQSQDGQTQLMSGIEGQVEYPEGVLPVPGSTTYMKIVNLYELVMKGIVKIKQHPVDRVRLYSSIGNKLLGDVIIPTEYYPIVPLINNFDRTVEPVGDVRRVKREQEFINSIRSLVVAHASGITNFKIGYPDGRYTEAKLTEIFNDSSKKFIPYDPELSSTGLQILAPPPLPNHLYTLEMQARKNILDRLGIVQMMEAGDAPNSYKGTVAIDEMGQRRIKSKKDDIEEFLNFCGKICIDMIQAYYTEDRAVNIVSPNDKPMSVKLRTDSMFTNLYNDNEYRITDLTVGKWDLIVISGSTLPSNRMAMLELYMNLFSAGIVDQQEVLKKTEVANVQEVLERMDYIKKLEGMLQQAQEQIKKLSGDLQTGERDVMYAKRESAQKIFQANLNIEKVKAQAARMIYESEIKKSMRGLNSK